MKETVRQELIKDSCNIFIDQLNEETQQYILDFLGLNTAEEGNLDTMPLFSIPKSEV